MVSNRTESNHTHKPSASELLDVVIVGAGISGIGGAYHLGKQCPGLTYRIIESQDTFGGTWQTHRYPGIRSDSDLYTFGFRFKPWTGPPIATRRQILDYLSEVIDENDLAQNIQYGQQITSASWSSKNKRWSLTITDKKSGDTHRLEARFLWMCQGYYRHARGYTPDWPGMQRFNGRIVHPQTWPNDLETVGKRIVVIGSGATAATLIPAIADQCEQLTMLQRSPTYFITARNVNVLADTLRELDIREDWIHEIVRRRILLDQAKFVERARTEPELVKQELLSAVKEHLGPDYDIEQHFTPDYKPWRQRIAFIPDGDLFRCIREKKAAVVTDQIECFTEHGIQLQSGTELAADVIITATGFDLNVLGDIEFSIDGKPLDFARSVTYKGVMFTGIPNMAWVFGYFRASWTLRADLIADFVCRLLNHMDAKQVQSVTPTLRKQDADMPLSPWVDPENFNPGYLMRGLSLLPQQGNKAPWLHTQDYWHEKDELPRTDLDDGSLTFK